MTNPNQNNPQKTYRISKMSAFLMICVSLLIDLIALIPIVDWFVTAFAFILFGFWFYIKGIPLISTRKIVTYITSLILGIFPFIPAVTIGVLVVIIIVRAEDLSGINITNKIKPTGPRVISKAPLR